MCQECHIGAIVRTLHQLRNGSGGAQHEGRQHERGRAGAPGWLASALCVLPVMSVNPVKEGSTGIVRSFV
eukprot:7381735-Prymnesium_polylepis.1